MTRSISPLPSFSLAYDSIAGSSAVACLFSAPSTYYAAALTIFGTIYDDAYGTFVAADGFYSDGVSFWVQSSGAIVSSGSC